MKSLLVTILLFTICAQAALISVAKDGIAQYSEVQPAINAATSGDTIFVAASSMFYSGFMVDRPLTIIGAGTDTLAGKSTKIGSWCALGANADNSSIQSMWFSSQYFGTGQQGEGAAVVRLQRGVNNVHISNCVIQNLFAGSSTSYYHSCLWIDTAVTATIESCILDSWPEGTTQGIDCGIQLWVQGGTGSIQLVVTNCIFVGQDAGISGGTLSTFFTVRQCIFDFDYAMISVPGSGSIENSFCRLITLSSSAGIAVRYCSAHAAYVPPGEGNIQASLTDFLSFIDHNPSRSDYHLIQGSAQIDAGNPIAPPDQDGSRADIGIYGGQTPYHKFGFPNYPIVTELEVPASVPQNGVLRFGARGRIGPGN